jgi:hypothetical protein
MTNDTNAQIFAAAFVEAAVFADTPEGYEGKDGRIGLASEDAEQMREFARTFYRANEADIIAYPEGITQAGHDLWFTINGHGVGYWENSDPVSVRLDAAAKALRRDGGLYEGDDGLLYWG